MRKKVRVAQTTMPQRDLTRLWPPINNKRKRATRAKKKLFVGAKVADPSARIVNPLFVGENCEQPQSEAWRTRRKEEKHKKEKKRKKKKKIFFYLLRPLGLV